MGIFGAVRKGFAGSIKLLNVILVFFIFNVIVGLISLPLASPDRAGKPGTITMSIVFSIAFFLVFIFLQGGALGLVRDLIKSASASISKFVEYGKNFYLRILGLLLIYILIAVGVVLVLSLISAGILLLGNNIVTKSIVAIIVTVAAITIITFLLYPIYALVAEDIGSIEALKRGIGIAKSNFWITLGLFVVMLIISLLISLIVGFIVGLVSAPLPVNISQIVIAIVNAIVQSYIPIVMMVAFMAFYLSLGSGKTSE